MSDLELRLDRLGAAIDWPETPELVAAVRAGLRSRPWFRRRRTLLVALAAALVAAAGVLAASESARSAILELLRIRGVEISYVDDLPPVALRDSEDALGRRVSLAEAEKLSTTYSLRVPTLQGLDDPDAVYFRSTPPGEMVTLVYGQEGARARLLLSQWYGSAAVYFYKVLLQDAPARRVGVGSAPGLWISGPPHVVKQFSYQGPDGTYRYERSALIGNVLLWEDVGVSYRLEADVPLDEALRIARSLR